MPYHFQDRAIFKDIAFGQRVFKLTKNSINLFFKKELRNLTQGVVCLASREYILKSVEECFQQSRGRVSMSLFITLPRVLFTYKNLYPAFGLKSL